MTHLCAAIFVQSVEQARRDIAQAAEAGADMVELRLDQFTADDSVPRLFEGATIPTIATCRPTWEGGLCNSPDAERFKLLNDRVGGRANYIDLELKSLQGALALLPRDRRPGLIASSHDFRGRPERLYNILGELNASDADVVKIVWMARTIRDNLEAFEILQQKQKPTIALCMGEAGLISRILAKKFGGFLTFASLDSSGGTAPGQISIADMKQLYRWDHLSETTRVYGVVGSPIMHSMSPAIHNASFDAVGHDGIYLPMLVEAGYESFKAFMETFLNFPALHLSGLSITIPHKENALRYLQEKNAQIDPLAQRIGALNTIVIGPDARLSGFSTDYPAILDCITSALAIERTDLARRRVAIIGAGGTGRTAVAALAHFGASVTIFNRTHQKAEELAREFDGKTGPVHAAPMQDLGKTRFDIYINTTPIGMHPSPDASPIDGLDVHFSSSTLVFDSIYNPMKTKLLHQAESAGAKTISGVEMFLRQAVGQFEAWTGKQAPTDIMRKVIEDRLSR